MEAVGYLLCESTEQCLEWWAHDLNDESLYHNIRKHSRQVVKWRCPVCSTAFEKEVYSMVTPNQPSCPECNQKKYKERDLEWKQLKETPVSSISELLAAWDDDRDPSKIMVIPQSPTNSHYDTVFRFKCPQGHHPKVSPYTYLKRGCPFCNSKTQTDPGKGYIADEWPELAEEWDLNNNGKNTPYNIRHNSNRIINWKCLACGYKWSESPKNRTNSYSACCPNCGKVLGSLGWKYPNIANEWDPSNIRSVWQVRRQTGFVPSWICSENPEHKWKASVISRINGSGCPYCSDASKSRVELMYYNAIKKVFPTAKSGATISSIVFSHDWIVDILINVDDSKIVVEYDGAYWHKKRVAEDEKKSLELLEAGFYVLRIRENGLEPLDIKDSKYHEIVVNPLSQKFDEIINIINNETSEVMTE